MELSFPKKPFRTKGGVKAPHHKNTAGQESVVMPPPEKVAMLMQQHIGAPCKPVVKKGDYVYAGQLIGESDAYVSAPIHASISGTVVAIEQRHAINGKYVDAVIIESDGKMEPYPDIKPPAEVKAKEDLLRIAKESGLVGLGGAGFPASVKLNVSEGKEIDTLIVNAAECEPYVTTDHREALENSRNVLDGIYKVKEILGVKRVFIAVEDNKPDAIAKLHEIADNEELDPLDEVRVISLKSRYPQGAEKVLIKACTDRVVPEGGLPLDVGCLVMNIASIAFLASYMRTGKPLTLKRITVDGSAIKEPKNVIVPIGTSVKDIIEFAGGYKSEPRKIVMGGPMMGFAITDDDIVITKQNNGVLAFDENEAKLLETTDCIRCGSCWKACPLSLMPSSMERASIKKDVDRLNDLHVLNCMECGCCSFACPAGRKLVQAFRLGKSFVMEAKRAEAEKQAKE